MSLAKMSKSTFASTLLLLLSTFIEIFLVRELHDVLLLLKKLNNSSPLALEKFNNSYSIFCDNSQPSYYVKLKSGMIIAHYLVVGSPGL